MKYLFLPVFVMLMSHCSAQINCDRIPIIIVDNRPVVEVKLNNQPFHLMIDCGGVNGIEPEVAERLNLPKGGEFPVTGPGGKSRTAYRTTVDSMVIGDKLHFDDQRFIVISFGEIKEKLNLSPLDGIAGYNLFRDSIIRIDYAGRTFCFLTDYANEEEAVDFTLYRNQIPSIELDFMGEKAIFIIDTGDRSELTILKSFAEKMNLDKKFTLSEPHITGYGIGGAIYAHTFTLPEFQFGNIKAKNVKTRIPMDEAGVFARTDVAGSIGSGLLKDIILTIDYQKRKIYFEENV